MFFTVPPLVQHKDPAVSGSIEGRLEWTYRRAAGAMLVTSITDACAFYANCINDITVVRIFGAFIGTMVLVNYILVGAFNASSSIFSMFLPIMFPHFMVAWTH